MVMQKQILTGASLIFLCLQSMAGPITLTVPAGAEVTSESGIWNQIGSSNGTDTYVFAGDKPQNSPPTRANYTPSHAVISGVTYPPKKKEEYLTAEESLKRLKDEMNNIGRSPSTNESNPEAAAPADSTDASKGPFCQACDEHE
jgi:hypothetical protein